MTKQNNITTKPLNQKAMKNKQTAVEWLFTQLDLISLLPREKWIEARKEILEQAKEMEKEQIMMAIKDSWYMAKGSNFQEPQEE